MVRERSFYLTMLKLSVPVALQGLATQLVGTADNIMVQQLGETAFSGVSTTNALTNFLLMFLLGLAAGSAVLVAQYWGKRDTERICSVAAVVLQCCILVALLGGAVFFFFPSATLRLMTSDTSIIQAGSVYLRVVAFSFVFIAITAALSSTLRCVELVGVTLAASLSSLFTNVILNYILIFGKFGFPALGIRGAALATFLARMLECVIMLIYMFARQRKIPIRVRHIFHFDRLIFRDYIRYGLPVALGDSQWALIGVGKGAIVGHLGRSMIAANNVAENMLSLAMIFGNSLASGACVLIGKSVGEKDYVKTRRYSNTIQILFACIGVVMCAIVYLLRVPFVNLFQELTPETRTMAMEMIALGALTMLGTSYHAACFMGINRGAGDSRFVFIVDMICGWLIVLPLSFLAAFVWKLPLPIVFLFIRIDQTFKWIIAFIRLRGDKWIKNVTRE